MEDEFSSDPATLSQQFFERRTRSSTQNKARVTRGLGVLDRTDTLVWAKTKVSSCLQSVSNEQTVAKTEL